MNIISIYNLLCNNKALVNNEVTVRGWVRNRRDSKIGISFINIYDGSCFNSVQTVVRNLLPNYEKDILRLTAGCSVIVTGKLVASPGYNQSVEIQANSIEVIGWIENPSTYPMSSKRHSIEYIREIAHLRPRTNLIGTITRIRHVLAYALHSFFNENGYFWVSTPIITASDAEGASKMFRVSTLDMENLPFTSEGKINYKKDFFGKESFLTVSGQLNSEVYACSLSKVYTFGPTFRAENSNTSRHLAEFWMLEPEAAFANLDDISNLAENMLKYVFKIILKKCIDDINFLNKYTTTDIVNRLNYFIYTNLIKIDYIDVIDILKKYNKRFKISVDWGIDLASEHEHFLTKEYFKSPVLVKNHPKNIKAFYMRLNDDDKTVASMDILLPEIGEVIGGSQREERLEILDIRMEQMGINKETYWWYRDLRRYGTVPHSGFGLGFERLVAYITGIHNIRDVIPFPRTSRNISF